MEGDLLLPCLLQEVPLVQTLAAQPGPALLTLGGDDSDGLGTATPLAGLAGAGLVTLGGGQLGERKAR